MLTDSMAYAGLAEVARLIATRRVSPAEVVDLTLARIERLNPHLNALLTVSDDARAQARAAERVLDAGKGGGPLLGVPISLKDLIETRGMRTTAGSKAFGEGLVSGRDAPVARRLRRAGAILIGKANLHELALGVTNRNEHFGPARNPWDTGRIPGGSSGGSAVAVAAGLGYGSVGSDTRGSIRIPAACCGVTGLKPTTGLVPTDGVIPLSWTLDTVGPITRSVADAALLLSAMVGGRAARRYLAALAEPAAPLRIGVCEFYLRDLDPEIERGVREAITTLRDAGHEILELAIPELDDPTDASVVITLAEAVTYHDRHLGERPEAIGKAVRTRLEGGLRYSAVDLVRAQRKRLEMAAAFDRAFERVDCLLGATVPAFPCPIESDMVLIGGREFAALPALTRLTAPQNMGGVPALSIPCGFGAAGLPIGLQLIGPRNRDEVLLALGAHFQRLTDWHLRRPPLGTGG